MLHLAQRRHPDRKHMVSHPALHPLNHHPCSQLLEHNLLGARGYLTLGSLMIGEWGYVISRIHPEL